MSDRERWVLYPLLFFSLVLGLRASYLDPWSFRCRDIECQNLKVSSINGSPYMNPVAFAPALEQALRQAVQLGVQTGNLPAAGAPATNIPTNVDPSAAGTSNAAAPAPAPPTTAPAAEPKTPEPNGAEASGGGEAGESTPENAPSAP